MFLNEHPNLRAKKVGVLRREGAESPPVQELSSLLSINTSQLSLSLRVLAGAGTPRPLQITLVRLESEPMHLRAPTKPPSKLKKGQWQNVLNTSISVNYEVLWLGV